MTAATVTRTPLASSEPDRPAPPVAVPFAVPPQDREAVAVEERRRVLSALDAFVRPLVRRRLLATAPPSPFPPVVDLTVYDRVYPATAAVGGHWTVAYRVPLLAGLLVSSYIVLLEFDAEQQPRCFRVCGAREHATADVTPAALDAALVQALRTGPATSWAPAFIPGISL